MIYDLTNIALLYSSRLAISDSRSGNLTGFKLIEYQKELICIRPILMLFYIDSIVEKCSGRINFEEFRKSFSKSDMASLIIPCEMRELCKRLILKISHTLNFMQNVEYIPTSENKLNFMQNVEGNSKPADKANLIENLEHKPKPPVKQNSMRDPELTPKSADNIKFKQNEESSSKKVKKITFMEDIEYIPKSVDKPYARSSTIRVPKRRKIIKRSITRIK